MYAGKLAKWKVKKRGRKETRKKEREVKHAGNLFLNEIKSIKCHSFKQERAVSTENYIQLEEPRPHQEW